MDDLISRKAMLSRVARIADISDDAREKMTDAVLGSKAVIDAIRVVRCRDCAIRFDEDACPYKTRTPDNGFCHKGTREEADA